MTRPPGRERVATKDIHQQVHTVVDVVAQPQRSPPPPPSIPASPNALRLVQPKRVDSRTLCTQRRIWKHVRSVSDTLGWGPLKNSIKHGTFSQLICITRQIPKVPAKAEIA